MDLNLRFRKGEVVPVLLT